MPKLLWVALPLLIAAALLGLQALLLRRAPSRHALNIWSSLLLTGYVATTAGLGIFWMANQQLPPFDWHYLFGYTTVLLVALHLAFNFPIAWRYLTRPPGAAPAALANDSQRAASSRRRWLGTLGVLLATGTAFVLGLRHGRSELRVQWPAPGIAGGADTGPAASPDQSAAALELVERYHAFSTHTRVGVVLRAPSVDWGDPPPPFKHYRDAPRIALAPFAPFALAAADAAPFGLEALAAVLWHTAGVTDARGPVKLRASPSSGALFSTELYVAARTLAGLPSGLWHYDAKAHALEQLAGASLADVDFGAPSEPSLHGAAAVIVATAVLRRTGHKYRDRSYRYVLADLGHALENLRIAAGASGAHAEFVSRFDESRAAATLGIDEREECVLALVALRGRAVAGPAPLEPARRMPSAQGPMQPETRWLFPPAPPVPPAAAGQALPLGVTSAVHLATSLRAAAPPASAPPAAAPAAPASPPPAGSLALPPAAASVANGLALIAARRSVRRFAPTPLAQAALAGVLAGMTAARSPPLLSAAVQVYVVVNAVAGLAPGAYRYERGSHTLVPRRASTDLRATAQAAALDQDAVGGAAVVFVLTIERATFAADPSGPARGYRHAFIEAGLVGERIYIEAGARGLGACGVGAFYDAEAAALVAIDPEREWVVHFAALGVPSA